MTREKHDPPKGDVFLNRLQGRTLVTVAGDDKGSEVIYASAAHLAIAMRLAFYGRSSLSELHSYLTKEGVKLSLEEVSAVVDQYVFRRYVLARGTDCYEPSDSLVRLVRRRAPSRAQLESRAKPSFI